MQSIITVNFFALVIFILNVLFLFGEAEASLSLAIVSFITFSLFMLYLLLRWPMFFFIILFFSFSQYTSIISNIYLESGAYALEVRMETYATGATLRLVTIDFIFILIAFYIFILFDYFFNAYKNTYNEYRSLLQMERVIFSFILAITMVMLINGVLHPFPLLSHMQRFAYWDSIPFGNWLSKLLYFLSYTSVVLAFYLEKYRSNRRIRRSISYLSLFLVMLAILYANKFSWLSNFFMMWLLGYSAAKYLYGRKIPITSILKKVLILLPFLLALVVFSYSFIHGYSGSDLKEMLIARIFALQGQMWWAIDHEVLSTSMLGSFQDIYTKYQDRPSGIFMLMEQVAPNSVFENFYERKIPFTMAYPAITLYSLGYLGAMFSQILFASYWMFIVLSLIIALYKANPIALLLSIFLFAAMLWAMLLGSTYVLFTSLNLTILALLLLTHVYIFSTSLIFDPKSESPRC